MKTHIILSLFALSLLLISPISAQNNPYDTIVGPSGASTPNNCTAGCGRCDVNDNNFCTTCADYANFIPVGGDCVPKPSTTFQTTCDKPCAACDSTGSYCLSCHTNFTLNSVAGTCTQTAGTVLQASTKWCTNSQCSKCFSRERTYCLGCWNGLVVNFDCAVVTSTPAAPSGMSVNIGCDSACSNCDYNDNLFCTTCANSGNTPVDGDCVPKPSGPYQITCNKPCATCDTANASKCLSCHSDFTYNTATFQCTANVNPLPESTQYCLNNECSQCFSHDRTYCTQCWNGLSDGNYGCATPITSPETPSGLSTSFGCDGDCSSCDINDNLWCHQCNDPTKIPVEGNCVDTPTVSYSITCDKPCATCTDSAANSDQCLSCHTGFTYDPVANTCTADPTTLPVSDTWCINNECATCFAHERTYCLSCRNGDPLVDFDCPIVRVQTPNSPSGVSSKTNCRTGCSLCDVTDTNYCTGCVTTDFLPLNGDCVAEPTVDYQTVCENPCATCSELGGSTCLSCYTGFDLDPVAGTCTNSSALPVSSQWCLNPKCSSCLLVNRYFCTSCWAPPLLNWDCPGVPVANVNAPSGSTVIEGCDTSCQSCDSADNTYCMSCPLSSGLEAFRGDCVEALSTLGPDATRTCNHLECAACNTDDLDTCTSCGTGFTLTAGRCLLDNGGDFTDPTIVSPFWSINRNCESCHIDNRYFCLSCWSGYVRDFGDCSVCNPFCATCQENSPTLCQTCPGGANSADGTC